MIDIRDHGGNYGGGKYRKGTELSIPGFLDFKTQLVAEVNIFNLGSDTLAIDDNDIIYFKVGSSAGKQLVNKYNARTGAYIAQLSLATGATSYMTGYKDGILHVKSGLKGVDRFNAAGTLLASYTTVNDVAGKPIVIGNIMFLPVLGSNPGIAAFNLDTGVKLYEWLTTAPAFGFSSIRVSKDQTRFIFLYTTGGNVYIYNSSGTLIQNYSDSSNYVVQAYMSDDNSKIYSTLGNGQLLVRTVGGASGSLVQNLPTTGIVSNPTMLPDGSTITTAGVFNDYTAYFLFPTNQQGPIFIWSHGANAPTNRQACTNGTYFAMLWYDRLIIVKTTGVIK